MKINDATTKENSLYHYTLFLLGLSSTDTTSFPVADFIRSANSWYRKSVYFIWKNSSTWEFDDSNYTTLPIATTALIDGQQDYSLPTNALDVQRVEVLDKDGNYQVLEQINKSQITTQALSEFYETAGMPRYYDVIGNSLMLYPKPSADNVTLTAGLKLYLARDIDAFTTTDTTKEPGILGIFHPYIAYGSAFDYAVAKNMNPQRIQAIQLGISYYEKMISDYYALRNKDIKVRIKPAVKSSI